MQTYVLIYTARGKAAKFLSFYIWCSSASLKKRIWYHFFISLKSNAKANFGWPNCAQGVYTLLMPKQLHCLRAILSRVTRILYINFIHIQNHNYQHSIMVVLPAVHVRVVRLLEGPLQLVQLVRRERCAVPSAERILVLRKYGVV